MLFSSTFTSSLVVSTTGSTATGAGAGCCTTGAVSTLGATTSVTTPLFFSILV